MSHPYSGAASYIYANEYRTPTQATHNILAEYDSQPSEKLYNDYQYAGAPTKTVELNFQVQSAHPTFVNDDSTRVAPAHRNRTKASRQVKTSPSTTIATLAFSPASQVSSLPSHTTSISRNYSHAYTNSHSSSHHTPSQTHLHAQPMTAPNDSFQYHSEPKPHYRYDPLPNPQGQTDYTVRAPKKPTPKLSIRTKFKLTLPNPFRSPASAWPPRSPTTNRRPGSPLTAGSPKSNWDWSTRPKNSRLSRWFSMVRKYGPKKSSPLALSSSLSYRGSRTSPNATPRSRGSQRLAPAQQYLYHDDRRNPLVVTEDMVMMTSRAAAAKRGKGSLRFAVQAPPAGSG